MKWITISTFALALALSSCHFLKKAEPLAESKSTRTNEDAPVPTRLMSLRHPGSFGELGFGHAIYMRKCGECHPHKFPDEIKSTAWHIHVPGMAWNAGIEPQEEAALLLYLQAASKDYEAGRQN